MTTSIRPSAEGASGSAASLPVGSVKWCVARSQVCSENADDASKQTPSQVYIDVESHEMVDVIDAKACYPTDPDRAAPFSEKGGKLSAPHSLRAL